jgi:hypothetical protein
VTRALNRKAWCEAPTCERVHGGQPVSFLDQLCQFIDGFFNLATYFLQVPPSVSYDNGNRVVLRPELVMIISKVAKRDALLYCVGLPSI